MMFRRQNRGFSILCLIIGIAIMGILMQNYFSADPTTGEPWAVSQTNRVRQVAAAANFRTAQTNYFMQTDGRRPEIQRLRTILDGMAPMANGGRFFVDANDNLRVTNQLETRKFSDYFKDLPAAR